MDLKSLRQAIDAIDARILGLLNKRAKVILDIGKIKSRSMKSIYVPEREKNVYDKLVSMNRGPLPNSSLKSIYREVMSSALAM